MVVLRCRIQHINEIDVANFRGMCDLDDEGCHREVSQQLLEFNSDPNPYDFNRVRQYMLNKQARKKTAQDLFTKPQYARYRRFMPDEDALERISDVEFMEDEVNQFIEQWNSHKQDGREEFYNSYRRITEHRA